ncbi:MAG: DUF393 domain-containing protein [Armatimonadetes bacterium]|nr:DUF393 domain-containing protein [Armatimonadota bacterium]
MPPTLLFDDTCRFCIAGTRRLHRLSGRRVLLVPSRSAEGILLLPDRSRTEGQMALLTSGHLYGGAEAIAQTLMLSPLWRPVVWAYYLPGVRQLADRAYRWVAARRHCLGGRCELPPITER